MPEPVRYTKGEVSVRLRHSPREAERKVAVLYAESILSQADIERLRREMDGVLDAMLKAREANGHNS